MALTSRDTDLFERSRGRLEAIAYRLLGSAGDAEDAVQDTFLRWQAADRAHVETPEAWLTKVLTNLCLNQLTSARARRETYVGQWLPEPVLAGDRMLGPAETAEQRDSVSFAVLTLLERLTPNERAVYVLREAFGYSHAEIGEILELSESNSQQIHHRAKQHVAGGRARVETDAAAARKIVEEFLAATLSGDVEPLVKLLTDDAVSIADGGGHVPARTTPLIGALAIARLLRGIARPATFQRFVEGGTYAMHAAEVNGAPALLVTVDDRIVSVIALEVTADGIAGLHIQANPEKLDRFNRRWTAAGEPLAENW
ncbi:RNA polymerase sigma-70 factor [Paractinoplanes toevensis]|uniref:DNA-directed RNA polymerase sigma-70 factor n=1 Tax=Paractinoplanes toevensis TaxID=571911 RepID=A0A919TFD7_9ACTN|nr:RNA polymerase sigma-70 factor [Actinoplanes toevensis]GIM93385.1 DNA-directed RNA polymerase sigma-70 factor [Actinoplanes toevensis]